MKPQGYFDDTVPVLKMSFFFFLGQHSVMASIGSQTLSSRWLYAPERKMEQLIEKEQMVYSTAYRH